MPPPPTNNIRIIAYKLFCFGLQSVPKSGVSKFLNLIVKYFTLIYLVLLTLINHFKHILDLNVIFKTNFCTTSLSSHQNYFSFKSLKNPNIMRLFFKCFAITENLWYYFRMILMWSIHLKHFTLRCVITF